LPSFKIVTTVTSRRHFPVYTTTGAGGGAAATFAVRVIFNLQSSNNWIVVRSNGNEGSVIQGMYLLRTIYWCNATH